MTANTNRRTPIASFTIALVGLGWLCFPFFGYSSGGSAKQPTSNGELQQRVQASIQRASPAVVCIAGSTGTIISEDGLILWQAHVTHDDRSDGDIVQVVLADGKETTAKLVACDRGADVSLAKMDGAGPFPHLQLGNRTPKLGDYAIKLGHPASLHPLRGLVARLGRVVSTEPNHVAADCLIIGGDSGGPFVDLDGELLGPHQRTDRVNGPSEIVDALTSRMVSIDTEQKTYTVHERQRVINTADGSQTELEIPKRPAYDYYKQLTWMPDDSKRIDLPTDTTINGHRVRGVRVVHSRTDGTNETTYWTAIDTGHVIQVKSTLTPAGSASPQVVILRTDFDYKPIADKSIFSVVPPSGFKVKVGPILGLQRDDAAIKNSATEGNGPKAAVPNDVKFYAVQDLPLWSKEGTSHHMDLLIHYLEARVDSTKNGGDKIGTYDAGRGMLVVRGDARKHEQIAQLLTDLRANSGSPAEEEAKDKAYSNSDLRANSAQSAGDLAKEKLVKTYSIADLPIWSKDGKKQHVDLLLSYLRLNVDPPSWESKVTRAAYNAEMLALVVQGTPEIHISANVQIAR